MIFSRSQIMRLSLAAVLLTVGCDQQQPPPVSLTGRFIQKNTDDPAMSQGMTFFQAPKCRYSRTHFDSGSGPGSFFTKVIGDCTYKVDGNSVEIWERGPGEDNPHAKYAGILSPDKKTLTFGASPPYSLGQVYQAEPTSEPAPNQPR
jgi:hypothetical protein